MIKEYFRIAFRSLSRRQLRSWLTMIGIFIGIAAVVSLISLGQGMQNEVYSTFQDIGSDKLFIQPKAPMGIIGDTTAGDPLTEDDVDFLKGLNGVQVVTYQTIKSAKIEFQDSVRYFTFMGVPTEKDQIGLLDSLGIHLASGSNLAQGDKYKAVIGFHHNERGLYDGKNIDLNNKFFINDQKFIVKGILEPIGSTPDDRSIIIPINTFRELTGIEDRVDMIIVKLNEGVDPILAGDFVERSLANYRGVRLDSLDFTVQTPEDLLASFQTILNIVNAVLLGIALISLFVGSVGIMNTMYTSVLERKKEIGIMKAIGAKNIDIFWLFFIESGILGLVGGIIGIIIGISLASGVELISAQALGKTFLKASYSIWLFLGALFFSFFVGALAGTLPAIQASKEKPSETLRDE